MDFTILVRGKGRTGNFLAAGIGNSELPPILRSLRIHGLVDIQFAVVGVGEGYCGFFVGLDFKPIDSLINEPVFIAVSSQSIAGFFCIEDTGIEIVSGFARFIGGDGADLLCAGFIAVNGDFPTGQVFSGIGGLSEPSQTLLLILPFIHNGFTGFYSHIVESQLTVPVIIIHRQFLHRVAAQRQIASIGFTVFIGGVVTHMVSVSICHPESPAAQMVSGVGGFLEFDASEMGVGKGNRCGLVNHDLDFLHRSIKLPVGIISRDLLCVKGAGFQTADGDGAVGSGGERRTGYGLGAGRIIVKANKPANQVLSGIGLLY